MKIDIVIPNYNGELFLKNCINSILSTDNIGYVDKIIIIDNNSQDKSLDSVNSSNAPIIIEKNNENYGFAKAVNQGIKMSTNEYILLLNNDTIVEDGFIHSLIECIRSSNEIFSVSSKMLQYHNLNLIDDAGDFYNILGWARKRGDGKSSNLLTEKKNIFSACAGAALYNRKVFDEIGYFDENFFAYLEDIDIGYRAQIFGYKNIYCPNAIVHHIGSGTSGSKYNEFKVKLSGRNNIYLIYKNMPLLQIIINFPFLILGFIIKYLFFSKKQLGKVYLSGVLEGISTFSRIKKTKFKFKNLVNYIKIQFWLIYSLLF